jgi:hypothetical protein
VQRYKIVEVTPEEYGKEKAEMLAAFLNGLVKKGIKQDIAEKMASTAAGAMDCRGDGCSSALARPWDPVISPR